LNSYLYYELLGKKLILKVIITLCISKSSQDDSADVINNHLRKNKFIANKFMCNCDDVICEEICVIIPSGTKYYGEYRSLTILTVANTLFCSVTVLLPIRYGGGGDTKVFESKSGFKTLWSRWIIIMNLDTKSTAQKDFELTF
jgi:hypothetical protein